MKIIMDSREPNEVMEMINQAILKYEYPIETERKHLYVGDYIIKTDHDTVPVERKQIADYLMGIQSGRLATQLYHMSSKYEFSFLVNVGYFSLVSSHTKMRRDSYIASLINASIKRSPEGKRGQIVTVNLENDYDFALFMIMLCMRLQNGSRTRLPIIERTRDNSVSAKAAFFTAIPGVGNNTAKKIISHFGTLKKAVNSDPEEYMKIKGIGKKLSHDIYQFFNN